MQVQSEGTPSEPVQPDALAQKPVSPSGASIGPFSSPDNSMVPDSSSHVPKDFKSYQGLLRCVTSALSIQAVCAREYTTLLNNLQSSAPGRMAFPINEAPLEPSEPSESTPALLLSTPKYSEKRLYISMKGF